MKERVDTSKHRSHQWRIKKNFVIYPTSFQKKKKKERLGTQVNAKNYNFENYSVGHNSNLDCPYENKTHFSSENWILGKDSRK